jgi:hypothetical protein
MRIFRDLEEAGLQKHLINLAFGVIGLISVPMIVGLGAGSFLGYFRPTPEYLGYFIGATITFLCMLVFVSSLAYQLRIEWKEVFEADANAAAKDDSISGPFWAIGFVLAFIISSTIFLHAIEAFFPSVDLFSNESNPRFWQIALFVIDHACRGMLFGALEALKTDFSPLSYRGGINVFSFTIALFRLVVSLSFFSSLFFAYRWYKVRIQPQKQA